METKICSKCKRELPATFEYFHAYKRNKDGLKELCKECRGSSFGIHQINKVFKSKEGYKYCSKCHRELPATEEYFYRNRNDRGYVEKCKECYGANFGIKKINFVNPAEQGYKFCSKCLKKYLLSEKYFYKNKSSKDGFSSRCIECYGNSFRAEEGYKICPKCNNEFPATNEYFYKAKNKAYGLNVYCKQCDKIRCKKDPLKRKAEYEKNKLKYRVNGKRYRQANQEQYLIYRHQRMAKFNSLPNNFSKKEWEQCKIEFDSSCAYCGNENIKLTQEHFIPLSKNGEYTKSNIIPACESCNYSKNDRDFYDWYLKQPFYSKEREQKILDYLGYDQKQSISI